MSFSEKKIYKKLIISSTLDNDSKTFSQGPIAIGRSPECQYSISDKSVSRSHLRVEWNNDHIMITDLGSSFGTFIDSKRIENFKPYQIKKEQKIILGQYSITLKLEEESIKEIQFSDPDIHPFKSENKSSSELEEQIRVFTESAAIAHQKFNDANQKLKTIEEELHQLENSLRYKKEEKEALDLIVKELNDEKKNAIELKGSLSNELIQLQNDVQTLKPEVEELKKIKQISEPEVIKIKEELNKLNKELDEKEIHFETVITEYEKNKSAIQKTIESQNKEKELNFIKLKITEEKQKSLNAEVVALELTITQLTENKKQTEIELLKSKNTLESIESDIQFHQEFNQTLKKENEDFKSKNQFLNEELSNKTIQVAQLKTEMEFLNNLFNKTKEEIEFKKSASSLKNEIVNKNELLLELNLKIEKSNKTLDSNNNLIQELNEKLKILNETYEKLETTKKELALTQRELELIHKERSHHENILKDVLQTKSKTELFQQELNQKIQDLHINLDKLTSENEALHLKIQNLHIECEKIEKQRNTVSDLFKKEKDTLKEINQKIIKENKVLRDKTARSIFNAKKRLKNYLNKFQLKKESEAKILLNNAQSSALKYIQSEKNKLNLELENTKKKSEYELNEKIDKKIKELDLELKNKKIKSEEELQRYLFTQREEFNKALEKDKLEFTQRKKERVKIISQCIEELILQDVSLIQEINKIKPNSVNHLSYELNQIIELTLGENKPDATQLKKQLHFNPDSIINQRKFWKKVSMVAVGLSFVFTVFTFIALEWEKIQEVIQNKISQEKETSDKILKAYREERIEKFVFTPELKEDYQETYTDNIIYNRHYLAFKTDQEVNKEWILRLNKFFIDEMDLNDRIIVKFMPLETKVLAELQDLRKALIPQNIEKGIENMRNVEQKFIDEVSILIEGRTNFHKLKMFEKKFFDEWVAKSAFVRVPATEQK